MHEFLGKLWSMEFGAALLGAMVGGGFTILGSWLQAKSSHKAATLAQATANAQRSFDTLTQLKTLLESQPFQGMGTAEGRAAWNRERQALITVANSGVMLLPEKHKETRGRSLMALRAIKDWSGIPPWPEYRPETGLLLSEALKLLGIFLRGSKIPEKQDMTELIARELQHYRRTQMHQELENLERDAELNGLDDEDAERVRQLRDALDIPHPPMSSDDSAG